MSKLRAKSKVSIAIGTKWWDLDSRAYFSLFLASAAVATALAPLVASEMYEAAKVSTQVKSQTRHWPDFHGAMEQPLGCCMYDGIDSSMPQKMTLPFDIAVL